MLKDVEPEDIEDETDRFVHLFTEERDSDVVKRTRLKKEKCPFIWEEYEREQNRAHKGISRTKDFKYPLILPIVYYEGKDNWTAAVRLHDRVFLSDVLGECIPDYRCIMMQLNKYSNRKLMEFERIPKWWY